MSHYEYLSTLLGALTLVLQAISALHPFLKKKHSGEADHEQDA